MPMSLQNNPLPKETERTLAYVDALKEGVEQEMSNDDSVFVFGLDVDDHKAIQGSTRGLLEKFGPERVFTTPLSEDAMTGVAIGAAMAGMRPVHVHIRMDFLMLCMNQLVNIAAKSRYMYGGSVKVPLVVRSMIGKSWGQGAQHSQALYSMFMHVPGLKVIAPSNAHDAKGAMAAAIQDDNPVIFVEHRLLYPTESYVPEERYTIEFGKARIVRSGSDVTLLGISNMVMECLRSAELLEEIGISAEVVDPISLAPLDIDTILDSAIRTKRLIIVDNAWTACGASAEILSQVIERAGPNSGIEVRRMGFAPTPCPTTPLLEDEFYPNPATIGSAAFEMVRPRDAKWTPDPERTQLAYQKQFKGPF
jgi:acetoin:2,6-dichlorophenolindophenol oxidoreductase subunit beta